MRSPAHLAPALLGSPAESVFSRSGLKARPLARRWGAVRPGRIRRASVAWPSSAVGWRGSFGAVTHVRRRDTGHRASGGLVWSTGASLPSKPCSEMQLPGTPGCRRLVRAWWRQVRRAVCIAAIFVRAALVVQRLNGIERSLTRAGRAFEELAARMGVDV